MFDNPFAAILDQVDEISERLPLAGADRDEAESVEMTVQSVRSWAQRTIDAAAIDHTADVARSVYSTAADLGLFGLTIPQEYDGAGFSLSGAARIIEEVATFDRSVATSIGLHCGLGLRGLIHFGSSHLRERFLPRLASGESIAAFAATEPEAGSHIAGVKTVGAWDGNQHLTVSGSKCYVTNGAIADVFTILARTPGLGGARRGYSLLLLTRDMPGIEIGAEEHKLGIRGSSTTTVSFDDVRVSTQQVIGEPGKGLDLISEVLAWGRTLMAAGCLGSARAAYGQAATYVQERRQFGRPIGSFGLVREKVAQMRALLYATESLVKLTTLLHSRCGSDIIWESSIAKIFASESVWQIADDALQLHGGAGFIEDTGVARILRDCRITRIFEGANEVLRFHVASAALAFAGLLVDLPRLDEQVAPALSEPAARFDALVGELAGALCALRERHGIRITEHQALLGKLADAAIGLYTLLAVVLRTHGELQARGTTDSDKDQLVNLARYTSWLLGRRIEEGLAASQRAAEEELVYGLSETEYARH